MSAPFIALEYREGVRALRSARGKEGLSHRNVLGIQEEFINKLTKGPPYSSPQRRTLFYHI